MPDDDAGEQPARRPSEDASKSEISDRNPSTTSPEPSSLNPQAQPHSGENDTSAQGSRAELLDQARTFLLSPQVRHENIQAKRQFLLNKGLKNDEVESLLQELPLQLPSVPPRTYPQPPPSRLPNLLLGLFRLFTWVAGGSAALLLVYYRYLLPRLAQSLQARLSLVSHQRTLVSRLHESVQTLKAAQTETFAVLPRPSNQSEDPLYRDCHSLDEALLVLEKKKQTLPNITVLRCSIEDLAAEGRDVGTESLFESLRGKLTWIQDEEWPAYQNDLWDTLSTTPCFVKYETPTTILWKYVPPTPTEVDSLSSSLASLLAALPGSPRENRFQHTLQALSDFTGYLTTQMYALPQVSPTSFRLATPGMSGGWNVLSPQEEEVRREIRALKGLVLNRRSFLPNVPRLYTGPGASQGPIGTTSPAKR